MIRIAEVMINNSVRQLGKIFHYVVSEALAENINIGQVVLVPFGKSNKMVQAFVVGFVDDSEYENLKQISQIILEEQPLKKELVDLAFWMSREYMCNVSSCLKIMLPPVKNEKMAREKIKIAALNDSLPDIHIKGSREIIVLDYLRVKRQEPISVIMSQCRCSASVIKNLEKKGFISIEEQCIDKNPMKDKEFIKTVPFMPTESQKETIEKISQQMNSGRPGEFLIHGVTGSGKTEIYLQLIQKNLQEGKQAIVLVPEISLTPQMINRFVGRFGSQVAILHSRLSDGERSDQWHKIKEGKVNIVVGARSAIFAPFDNLGIIIIDEEHENTYKSETTPKYHARDVARKRCELENGVLVLGSATPSVETYNRAVKGEIDFSQILNRANDSRLPEVEIVDMRQELEEGNKSVFSNKLYEAIKKNIEDNNQTILFLNRRGYSSFVLCRNCGYVAKCKKCNISMTYHMSINRLVCHYCGHTRENYQNCPSCKSQHIRHFGIGTQRLEEEVKKHFPNASVLRMDLDTTSTKNAHEKILKKFQDENINILIGTQMIAKGHDFPNVTLVGILSADMMLGIEDYRSSEKTFQLLTQVAGRAGRAEKNGRVIVQTYNVDHFSITTAKRQDYVDFYKNEIIIREELGYPPFLDIISILFTGKDQEIVKKVTQQVENILKKEFDSSDLQVLILNGIPAPISKINNKYRWRIIIKCKLDETIKEKLNELIQKEYDKYLGQCNISIDVNPVSMM
jgi:primosomal protein N' (replication factor Y)